MKSIRLPDSPPIVEGDLVWDEIHQHFGVVMKIHEGLAYYEKQGDSAFSSTHFWSALEKLSPIDREPGSSTAVPPAGTIYDRMIGDLIASRPRFSTEGDRVWWADYDDSTYLVEVTVPGVS